MASLIIKKVSMNGEDVEGVAEEVVEEVRVEGEDAVNQKLYGIGVEIDDIWPEKVIGNISKMETDELKQAVEIIKKTNKDGDFSLEAFDNDDFLINMINNVDLNEIPKYLDNTFKYARRGDYDPNFVLCFRRAIPTEEEKTENFWSTNFNEVLNGLRAEISEEQRILSAINVTTLNQLEKHGIVTTNRGISDGEIAIDPNKNFPSTSFLFRYKPWKESVHLKSLLEKGAISREQVLSKLKENNLLRMKEQGLPVDS